MTELLKQLASSLSATFAALCCAGAGWALAALGAIGAGFLVNDAVLIPLFAALLGLSVWFLHRTTRAHGMRAPFHLGLAGAVAAFAGVWIWLPALWSGLAALVAASLWDFFAARIRRGGVAGTARPASR